MFDFQKIHLMLFVAVFLSISVGVLDAAQSFPFVEDKKTDPSLGIKQNVGPRSGPPVVGMVISKKPAERLQEAKQANPEGKNLK